MGKTHRDLASSGSVLKCLQSRCEARLKARVRSSIWVSQVLEPSAVGTLAGRWMRSGEEPGLPAAVVQDEGIPRGILTASLPCLLQLKRLVLYKKQNLVGT